jgi:acetyltransferase-like isoleucine patch superfamily enzyme
LPPSAPVVVEHHVWIGSRVIILPGVHIGHHAAIGAGSVVTTSRMLKKYEKCVHAAIGM